MKNKKIFSTIIIIFLAMMFAGCGDASKTSSVNNRKVIVCTIFPEYDWVRNIIAGHEDEYDLRLLISDGTDPHNFQPSVKDVALMSSCDILINVGGESDEWVGDALDNARANGKDVVQIELLTMLGDSLKEEELKEGMQGEEEEEPESEDEEEGPEYDEHVWLSLRNTKLLTAGITEVIAKLDPANEADYRSNLELYTKELDELDAAYEEVVSKANYDTLLFGDRFPFRYMVEDYGLGYYAAFIGCSAETEASFSTVVFLSDKLTELNLPAVMIIENSSANMANTIIRTSGDKEAVVLVLDSMQAKSNKDIINGVTYLSVMSDNLSKLKQALN